MGMYRTVECELRCGGCNRLFADGVQFKTGDDGLERYVAGQIVPAADDMVAGARYRAVGFHHCRDCTRLFSRDEARAHFHAVAELVEEGMLRFTMIGSAETVDGRTIREKAVHAARCLDNTVDGVLRSMDPLLDRRELVASWLGAPIAPLGDGYFAMLDAYHERVDRLMRLAGWEHGRDCVREDLAVVVDSGRRIRVIHGVAQPPQPRSA